MHQHWIVVIVFSSGRMLKGCQNPLLIDLSFDASFLCMIGQRVIHESFRALYSLTIFFESSLCCLTGEVKKRGLCHQIASEEWIITVFFASAVMARPSKTGDRQLFSLERNRPERIGIATRCHVYVQARTCGACMDCTARRSPIAFRMAEKLLSAGLPVDDNVR